MTREEFITEIEDIISADEGTIGIDTILANEEDWDSLAIISFIAMSDKKLAKKVDVASIKSCQTIEDLMKIVGI
jgi:acyl carrier protein